MFRFRYYPNLLITNIFLIIFIITDFLTLLNYKYNREIRLFNNVVTKRKTDTAIWPITIYENAKVLNARGKLENKLYILDQYLLKEGFKNTEIKRQFITKNDNKYFAKLTIETGNIDLVENTYNTIQLLKSLDLKFTTDSVPVYLFNDDEKIIQELINTNKDNVMKNAKVLAGSLGVKLDTIKTSHRKSILSMLDNVFNETILNPTFNTEQAITTRIYGRYGIK